MAALSQRIRLKLTQVPMTKEQQLNVQIEAVDEIAKIEREFGMLPAQPREEKTGAKEPPDGKDVSESK